MKKQIYVITILLLSLMVSCAKKDTTSDRVYEDDEDKLFAQKESIDNENQKLVVEFEIENGKTNEITSDISSRILANSKLFLSSNSNVAYVNQKYYYMDSDLKVFSDEANEENTIDSWQHLYDNVYYQIENIFDFNDKLYASVNVNDEYHYLMYDFEKDCFNKEFKDLVYYKVDNIDEMINTNLGLNDLRYANRISDVYFDKYITGFIDDSHFENPPKYYLYDILSNELIYLKLDHFYHSNYDWIGYNDDYIFVTDNQNHHFDYNNFSTFDNNEIFIIDRRDYGQVARLDLKQISKYEPKLFKIEKNAMFFYCEEDSTIIEYDISTGIISVIIDFKHDSNFIDYDINENSLYLKICKGFSYKRNTEQNSESKYERLLSTNIETENLNIAEVEYIKFNLDNYSYEIFKTFDLKNYMDKYTTSKYMQYVRVEDYIFAYNYSTLSGYTFFAYKFKYK